MTPMLVLLAALAADTAETHARSVSQLADGIYEIRHPDAPDGFPQGNTTVVVGRTGVLVVDSCLLPSSAREDIEQIKRWTTLPVAWLVNTHWHFDHTLGNATYAAAFPRIHIVAQAASRELIAGYNPGAVARYPTRAERLQKMLDSGKGQDGRPLSEAVRNEIVKSLPGLGPVVAEMKTAAQLAPDVWFDHELSIDLGGRVAQLRFLGRGNTGGDAVVWLPQDGLVVAGDLLDHPVPYFFGGFPVELLATLERLRELNAKRIVPGHGEVLEGTGYIGQVIELVSAVKAEVEKELNSGMARDQVLDAVPRNLDVEGFRRKFAGGDPANREAFDASFEGLVRTMADEAGMR